MIKMLAPLFALDPLFRRTFLLVVPCRAFGRITASGIFTALEMCTTLARIVQDKRFMSQEEVSFFCHFIKTCNVLYMKFDVPGNMTFAGDWAVCRVSHFVELRAQVGSSNVVWPQKWHHTKCLWESGEGTRPSVWLTNWSVFKSAWFSFFCHIRVTDFNKILLTDCRQSLMWLHARKLG